jgi:uracil-DNA glycosylase
MSTSNFNITKLINTVSTDWHSVLKQYIDKYRDNINSQINKDTIDDTVFPPPDLIFNAFTYFDTSKLKVVIIGQDPYINKGEAMGLSFSVPDECKMPPSLRNVFKELEAEYGEQRTNKNLSDWAEQGVLLLNAALTVRKKESLSHMKIWREYTTDIIKHISSNYINIVYILWGDFARKYKDLLDGNNNLILEWSHPSPLSRKPFVGNNHFKKCNEYLEKVGKECIKWV